MKNIKLLLFCLFLIAINPNLYGQIEPFLTQSHTNTNISSEPMPYRLSLPLDYDANKSYPLVLFLHGAGERGTDNNLQLTANQGATLWAKTENQTEYPAFVLAPQCGSGKQWVDVSWSLGSYNQDNTPISEQLEMVVDILNTLPNEFNIDSSKIYVTGLSMGGYGTFDLLTRYPDKFAAGIAICGAGDPTKAELIGTIPLRVFHSSNDGIVPVSGSREMVDAINALGTNNRGEFYTEYNNAGHAAWTPALNQPDLVPWLFGSSPIILESLSTNDSIQNEFKIYPNPIPKNSVKIELAKQEKSNIIILNTLGQIVYKNTFSTKNIQINNIQLKKGIYIIHVKTKNNSISKQLLIN